MRRVSKSQRQESGAGSQQIQVAGDLVQVLGVTEQRAVEIAREQSRIAIQDFTAEASAQASIRMEKLDNKVVDELSARGLLEAFADPAFQVLLRKTQLHAATTSEEADYELLSKLLLERAGKPSKPIHMVVTRAVEVVEYIDPEALMGLMFLWVVMGLDQLILTRRQVLPSSIIWFRSSWVMANCLQVRVGCNAWSSWTVSTISRWDRASRLVCLSG